MRASGRVAGLAAMVFVLGCGDGTGDAQSPGDTGANVDSGGVADGAGGGLDADAGIDTGMPGSDAALDVAVLDTMVDVAGPDAAQPDVGPPIDVAVDTGGAVDVPIDPACWADLPVGQATVFVEGMATGTEGIAFGPDGALYVSVPSEGKLYRIAPDGTYAPFADTPEALGVALSSKGTLLVADKGPSNSLDDLDGSVLSVTADGTVSTLASGIASPNFLVEAMDGSVLVSDDFDTRLFRVLPDGTVEVALTDIASPNGMGYSPDRTVLYVASTFTADGEITRVPVDAQGLPTDGERTVIAKLAGAFPDGLAVDAFNRVYVAANIAGKVVRIPGQGGEQEVVGEGMQNPASLAFGVGPDFDPCSIYITELFGTRIWRLSVGAVGVTLP